MEVIDRGDGSFLFIIGDMVYDVVSPEAKAYFDTEGCTCHPIFVVERSSIFIGGQDDCPIHGFGNEEEMEDENEEEC